MNLRLKLFVGFGFIVSITILLGITAFINLTEIGNKFEFLVEHDLNVLQNAQKLQKLVVDAETGQRGFVITGDENFLEPYHNGVNEFYELIQVEKELVSDNPSQVERLQKIEKLFGDWNENAAVPEIELARQIHEFDFDAHDLQNLLIEGTGKNILDELRILLDKLLKHTIEENHIEQQILLRQISKDLVDRETGQRGFLITGQEEFLEPYNLGNENLNIHLLQLLKLIQEEEEPEEVEYEKARINKIIDLSQSWDVKAGMPEIELRKLLNEKHGIEDVAVLLQAKTGKAILDNIRIDFDEFTKIENSLKDERFQTALEIESSTKISIIVLTIASVSVGGLVLVLLFRSIIRPILKLETASSEMAKGNLDVKIVNKGNDEISHLNKSFVLMRDSIKEKVKNERLTAIGNLSLLLAHDLRNPLTVISNDFSLIKKIHPELDQDSVKRIERGIDRIDHQVQNVLNFIKLNPSVLRNHSVSKLLKSVLHSIKIQKDIKVNLPDNDSQIICDSEQCEILFYNIIFNAVQELEKKGGTISIRIKEQENSIIIEFEDSGLGIPQANLEKIFEPLFTTKQHGTGLGLVSCKNIMKQFGGKISVKTNPTIFTLVFQRNL